MLFGLCEGGIDWTQATIGIPSFRLLSISLREGA